MTTYLDTSALVKLVVREAETEALHRYLRDRPRLVTASLARAELLRAVRVAEEDAIEQARALLDGLHELPLDRALLEDAAALDAPVRTLDAIHLAAARGIVRSLAAVVTYDRRMAVAADALGLPVAMPG